MKNNQSPSSVLNELLEKHGLNCNRLAKAINMSNAVVRLMVLGKSSISLTAALRFARFFKTKPEYWLNLQMKYDLEKAAADKSVTRELARITTVSNYTFVRKPHSPRKKTTLAGKRKAAGKVPGAKRARRGRRPKK